MPESIEVAGKNNLLIRLRSTSHVESLRYYIEGAFVRFPHCYLISITLQEYHSLIINASFEQREQELSERKLFPTIGEMIVYIKKTPSFITDDGQYAALYSSKLREPLPNYINGQKPQGCLIGMRNDFYVIDGMHRLLAFRLSNELDESNFPIEVYLCTRKQKTEI